MRTEVLKIYKQLFNTTKKTFGEDKETLNKVIRNIKLKFKENKNINDVEKIKENIKAAQDAENFIKNCVIQAKYNEKTNNYNLKIPIELPTNSVVEPINEIKIK